MTGKTHASCGMLVGALTTQYFQTDIFSSVTVIILATLASLLPIYVTLKVRLAEGLR
ncbi:hypothetical protein SA3139_SA3139_02364 [Staphylococcus aureus]|nr:hypothetical protein SA3139_SA3139_02364 [Staphylococcus aureus]